MERYLKDTYGMTIYQEQIMLLSHLLANFTLSEADELRRAMGKKHKEQLDCLKVKFSAGTKANGHDPHVCEKIWKDWSEVSCYTFNKSHATCYSWIAFQTAYLKANYPVAFMTALLNVNAEDTWERNRIINECKAMGIYAEIHQTTYLDKIES
jgi:DNA polymerase-3 subunit alpha